MTVPSKPRIVWFDAVKGFSIYWVLLHHILTGNFVEPFESNSLSGHINGWILSFNMPLFAIVSGYFFSARKETYAFLSIKTRQLLFPLFVWCAIVFCLFPAFVEIGNGILPHLYASLRNYCYALFDWGWWFLRSLFFCFIYAYFFVRLFRRNYSVACFTSIAFLYLITFTGIVPNRIPLLSGYIFLYPFFWVGYWYRHYQSFIEYHGKKMLVGLCCLWFLLLCFWGGYQDSFYHMNTSALALESSDGIVGWSVIAHTVFRFFIGAVGSVVIMLSFNLLFLAHTSLFSSPFFSYMAKIGESTLAIYILQTLVFDFTNLMHFEFLQTDTFSNLVLCFVLAFILLVGLYIVYGLTLKVKWLSMLLWSK